MAFGASALLFTACHRESGHPPNRQHTAIDPYQTTYWDNAGIAAIERAGLADYLELREQLSSLELPVMLQKGELFDMIYVDGSHMFEDVFVDFYFVRQMVAPNGIVAYDDCSTPEVAKVIRFIRKNMAQCFAEIDLSPFRWDGGKSFKHIVARALGRVQMVAFRRSGPSGRMADAPFHDF